MKPGKDSFQRTLVAKENVDSDHNLGVFKVCYSWTASDKKQMTVDAGDAVLVLFKNELGWAKVVSCDHKVGYVPFDFLVEAQRESAGASKAPRKNIENYTG